MSLISSVLREQLWLLQIAGVFMLSAVIHMITARILARLGHKTAHAKYIYPWAFVKALKAPVGLSIWLIALCVSAEIALLHYPNLASIRYLPQIKALVIVLTVSWTLIRFIRNSESQYIRFCVENSKEVDKTLVHALSQLSIIAVSVVSFLIAMQLFGLPISALLAFGGIGGAAIAFASKDLLANFFGSMVVYLDRPFNVGDWIRSPDKQIEGTVEFIGWRVTRIRTFDQRPLYVPNGFFLTISVENPSRMHNRRIKTNIGIRYQDADKMDVITQQVRQMLMEHPEIDTQKTLIVNFVAFGAFSLDFMVYTFTKSTDWIKFQAIQHEVFMNILRIIAANGAECALPTQRLFMQNEAEKRQTEAY